LVNVKNFTYTEQGAIVNAKAILHVAANDGDCAIAIIMTVRESVARA
jgi:hypothetical protein